METCKGVPHFLRDCGETSPEKCRELLKEFKKKAKDRSMKRVHWENPVKREMVINPEPTTDGKMKATLGSTVDVTDNGDYGCDHAAISEDILQELADKNVFVNVLPLSGPIRMSLAMHNEE